jgi:hypothetical protein
MSIPEGIYRARAIKAELDKSDKGDDVVVVMLEIQIGEGTMNAITRLYFSEKAAPYSLERLRALGWPGGTTFEKLPNVVDVTVKHEMYEGKPQTKVDILTGGGGIKPKNPPSPAEEREFFQRINKAMGAAPAPARTPMSKGGGLAVPSQVADDEIPF